MAKINKNKIEIIIRKEKENWGIKNKKIVINERILIEIKIIKKLKKEKINITKNESYLIERKK